MQRTSIPLRRSSLGFTLIEVGIVAILGSILMSGVLMFLSDQLRISRAEASGVALAAINTAVGGYEAQFSTNLANHAAIPIPGYANVVNPYAPTTMELTELGFLKTSVPLGVYGISINPAVSNGTPAGMAWIIQPFTDAMGRPDQALAGAAMTSAGGDAAMSTIASPSLVMGADNWSATNPQTNTPAIVAMRNGAGSAAYVRLDGSTPMQGSLNLNGNNLTSVNSLSAATVTASGNVTGNNVAAAGAVTAQNYITAANYVSSNGNIYAGQNVSANGSVSGSTLSATAEGNDVFFGSSALYSDGWNSVIRNTGGALYVQDFSGNLTPTVTSQVVTPGGNGVQVGSSYYYGDGTNSAIRQNGQLFVQNQAGTSAASVDAYRLTAEEYVQINGGAAAGVGCSPNGLVGRDGPGNLYSCVNGVWTQSGGGNYGGQYVIRQYLNSGVELADGTGCQVNPYTNACSCPAGFSDISYSTGQSYAYSAWDSIFKTHFCMK